MPQRRYSPWRPGEGNVSACWGLADRRGREHRTRRDAVIGTSAGARSSIEQVEQVELMGCAEWLKP